MKVDIIMWLGLVVSNIGVNSGGLGVSTEVCGTAVEQFGKTFWIVASSQHGRYAVAKAETPDLSTRVHPGIDKAAQELTRLVEEA